MIKRSILTLLILLPFLYACSDNNGSSGAPTVIAINEDTKILQAVELLLLSANNNITDILCDL